MSLIGRLEEERPARVFDFKRPLDEKARAVGGTLLARLVSSQAFRRLGKIRFLGGIDYALIAHPNGSPHYIRYTRYQHSLGVARLAAEYVAAAQIAPRSARLAITAALLHDVGHGPFSHSIEPVFKQLFGVDHHSSTLEIIEGRGGAGDELAVILREEAVDIDELVAVLAGRHDPFDGFFSGPINFDTIEGICRSLNYLSVTKTIDPVSVLHAAYRRRDAADRARVDLFWESKDEVYVSLIRSSFGVYVDTGFQQTALDLRDVLKPGDFKLDEIAFMRKHPAFRRLIKDLWSGTPEIVAGRKTYTKRRFRVDPLSDFFSRDDKERYRQRKIDMSADLGQNSRPTSGSRRASVRDGSGDFEGKGFFR